MLNDILARHRGPYIFAVCRPTNSSKFKGDTPRFATEWLKSEVLSEDVGVEAISLITDPRDTICSVGVWSQRENTFVTSIAGEKDL